MLICRLGFRYCYLLLLITIAFEIINVLAQFVACSVTWEKNGKQNKRRGAWGEGAFLRFFYFFTCHSIHQSIYLWQFTSVKSVLIVCVVPPLTERLKQSTKLVS